MTRELEASATAVMPVANRIKGARRLVVKIGSSLVTNEGMGLDRQAIHAWARQLAELVGHGCQVVLVSSGAVAEGVARLGLKSRPREVHLQQAAAAVGQMGLVQAYESCFQELGLHAAQVLLSHDDLSNRTRYLNARSTLIALLELGTVPVINENDTVATAELCFGDNDSLAALVANLINADAVIILTDQQGLFSADPRQHADAQLIRCATADDQSLRTMAGAGSELGRGGMQTKLSAARLAARSGTDTVICSGREESVVSRLYAGEMLGTYLYAKAEPVAARKQWLAGQLALKGKLVLDAGAARVVTELGGSLLPVGVTAVQGQFARGEVVACLDEAGAELARGLTNYASHEIDVIKGKKSRHIADLLGYAGETELIHRDNLVVIQE